MSCGLPKLVNMRNKASSPWCGDVCCEHRLSDQHRGRVTVKRVGTHPITKQRGKGIRFRRYGGLSGCVVAPVREQRMADLVKISACGA